MISRQLPGKSVHKNRNREGTSLPHQKSRAVGSMCHRQKAFWAVVTVWATRGPELGPSQRVFPEGWRWCKAGLIHKHPRGLPDMPERRGPVLQLLGWGYPEVTFGLNDLWDLIGTSFANLHCADEKARLRREMTQPKRSHGESESSAIDISLTVSSSLCSRQDFSFQQAGKASAPCIETHRASWHVCESAFVLLPDHLQILGRRA